MSVYASWTLSCTDCVPPRFVPFASLKKNVLQQNQNNDRGSGVAQRSKALHRSARGVTTDPGLIPSCITTGCDLKSHRAVHNWPRVGVGRRCKYKLVLNLLA